MDRHAKLPVLFSIAIVGFACGGSKAPRAPARGPTTAASPAPAPAAPPPASVDAPFPDRLRALAPEPRIRVGLTASAEVVRLTSSRAFRIGSGRSWIEAQDVLVVPIAAQAGEGFVYRVTLRTFPSESAASLFRSRVETELEGGLTTHRETDTARYAVRWGAFDTEAGAKARQREAARLGFEGTEVMREPSSRSRLQGLSMIAPGRAPVSLPAVDLLAVPGELGGFIEVDGSPYRGYVEIAVNRTNLFTVTNVVHLEDYLRGVVPAELSPEAFPEKEALKAQAVAARTYAVKREGEFAAEGYDICATAACQVYRGVSVEQRLSDEAVRETTGEVLTYGGNPIDALYTSTCGGRTENAENVFSTPQPYLVSRACFLESHLAGVVSRNGGAKPLSEAVLSRLGVAADGSGDAPPSYGEVRRWTAAVLERLGQQGCWREGGPDPRSAIDIGGLARLLGEALCWESRLPFLLSPLDAERIVGPEGAVPERLPLAFAVREGLIVPSGDGIGNGSLVGRRDAIETLYRLLESRGEPLLRDGRLKSIDGEQLVLADEALSDADNEISMPLAPVRYLFRSLGGATHYAPRLALLPNDRVRFHAGDDGIDVLVLLSEGATFDRTSRFSHWVVRKTREELSREVNLYHPVGEVLELRPMRYGRSGRLAELEIVGRAGSATVRGLAIRRTLGIRENLFFLDAQRGAEGLVRGWVFTGRGWGHGVGLCQVGAYGMAASGFSYREILTHYYPGTALGPNRGAAPSGGYIDNAPARP